MYLNTVLQERSVSNSAGLTTKGVTGTPRRGALASPRLDQSIVSTIAPT
jgi:hypothetical protein